MSINTGANKTNMKSGHILSFCQCLVFSLFSSIQFSWSEEWDDRILLIWWCLTKRKIEQRKDGRDRIEGERKCPHSVLMMVWTSRRFSSSCGRLDQARIQLPVTAGSPPPRPLNKHMKVKGHTSAGTTQSRITLRSSTITVRLLQPVHVAVMNGSVSPCRVFLSCPSKTQQLSDIILFKGEELSLGSGLSLTVLHTAVTLYTVV